MQAETLDPKRCAVLFFDMLNGHMKKVNQTPSERYMPVIVVAKTLLDSARAHDVMVAYAAANHRADNATSTHTIRDTDNRLNPLPLDKKPDFRPVVAGGTWEAAVIDELAPREQDYLIPKYRWSAFFQTYLDLALRSRGIDILILAGGSTDVGIASTAFAARDLDYNLVIVRDACTSVEIDNHDQLMNRMFPRMGRVRTAKEVAAMFAAH
jgi:ureidoacrylate peracid hydrolase